MERTCHKTVIHQIPNIYRCLHVKEDNPKAKVRTSFALILFTPLFSFGLSISHLQKKMITEGSNFYGIWEMAGDKIEANEIESNDIYAVLKTYGVEAARLTIVREVQGIFAAYGISVDGRHVELIADYMVSPYFLTA
jgi:DNA-directed RNA polymerase I subunit RPA1